MSTENAINEIAARVRGFAGEMRAKGIHVGMGSPAECVTCGELWPCSHEKRNLPEIERLDRAEGRQ